MTTPPTPTTADRALVTQRVNLYLRLLGIVGGTHAPQLPVDLGVLTELCGLDDAQIEALCTFVDRVEQRFAGYMTTRDLARLFSTSPRTIQRLHQQGKLEGSYWRGHKLIFTPRQVERFVMRFSYLGDQRAHADDELPPLDAAGIAPQAELSASSMAASAAID